MSRIYDYNLFSFNKKSQQKGGYSFGCEIKYIDIDINNRPEEYSDITDAKAFLEYSVDLEVKKTGISSLHFTINSLEIEFVVDDYPNPTKEFEIDLIPGKTIDIGQLRAEAESCPIPTNPGKVTINMNKSTDPRKFDVVVSFGQDYYR
jgi:hypothetical protein